MDAAAVGAGVVVVAAIGAGVVVVASIGAGVVLGLIGHNPFFSQHSA